MYHKNKSYTIHQNTYKFWCKPQQCFTGKDKVSWLKSYDFYNIFHFYIPIAIQDLTTLYVWEAIYRLSKLVRWISRKNINTNEIKVRKDKFFVIMTLLQMQFPTSFFDGQQYLMINFVDEVRLAGPMPYRWIFSLKDPWKHWKNLWVKTKAGGFIVIGTFLKKNLEKPRECQRPLPLSLIKFY